MPETADLPREVVDANDARQNEPLETFLLPETLDIIDKLCQTTEVHDRTQVVANAVRLAYWLVEKKAASVSFHATLPSGDVVPFPDFESVIAG